jgi:hypothetical protein
MPSQLKKKPANEALERSAFEEVLEEKEPGWLTKALGFLRAKFLGATRRRKHPRLTLMFSDPLLTQLSLDDQTIDVAPYDLSRGGMGLDVPRRLLGSLLAGQNLSLRLSFDGKRWQEVTGEVRYARPLNAARGLVGIQFTNPSPALLQAIAQYEKKRPGQI